MKKETFSATEVSKFIYCPLQWYYTRTIGEANIRAMYKELNHEKHERHEKNQNFIMGQKFHDTYEKKESRRKALYIALVIIFALSVCVSVFLWHRNI